MMMDIEAACVDRGYDLKVLVEDPRIRAQVVCTYLEGQEFTTYMEGRIDAVSDLI